MRNDGDWIELAIKVLLGVSAIGVILAVYVAVHFIAKHW